MAEITRREFIQSAVALGVTLTVAKNAYRAHEDAVEGKCRGRYVYDLDNKRILIATGPKPTDAWVDANGYSAAFPRKGVIAL